jgi:hypothetical protein
MMSAIPAQRRRLRWIVVAELIDDHEHIGRQHLTRPGV